MTARQAGSAAFARALRRGEDITTAEERARQAFARALARRTRKADRS